MVPSWLDFIKRCDTAFGRTASQRSLRTTDSDVYVRNRFVLIGDAHGQRRLRLPLGTLPQILQNVGNIRRGGLIGGPAELRIETIVIPSAGIDEVAVALFQPRAFSCYHNLLNICWKTCENFV